MSVCGARVVADTVQWAPRTDTVSDLSKDSHRPYIEFCKEHGRIGVVWDVFDALSEKQIVCSRFKNTSWDTIRDVSDTTASSRLATMSGDCAVWSKWDSTGIAQIWKSEYDSLTLSWGTQEVLFTSDEASLYPHTLFMLADSLQFTCWTENDSSPYAIAFRIDTLSGGGGVPCFYVDAGRPEASPYLQHRGGYRSWGGEPELTVDTDPHRVSYVFSGLDPRIDYGLRTVHYFEPKETAFIGTSITSLQTAPTVRTRTGQSELLAQTEHALSLREMQAEEEDAARSCAISPARKTASVHDPSSSASLTFAREKIEKTAAEVSNHWTMAIRLDGESSNSVDIAPKSVTTFRYEVPRTLTRDGALAVEIARTSGSVGGQPVNVGQQLTVGQGHHRFRFHRLAPNPSRDRGTLAYELAASCDVKVDVFDVAGRVVATLSRPGVPPGTQEIRWGPAEDLDTQTLATGTYFVRLTARNAASGSEEFSSTRKLVLIR
jgi:hypothetical protein